MRKTASATETTRSIDRTALVAYRALSDLAGKGAFFLITVVAARRLSPQAFGAFAIATTLGWIVGVATDFGIQLHLARTVARHRAGGWGVFRDWLRVKLWLSGGAVALVAILSLAWDVTRPHWIPVLLMTLVYVGSSLLEYVHYFYRGLSRTDLESSLTLLQRASMLALSLVVLAWTPTLTWLSAAMLLPVVATLVVSGRLAARLGLRTAAEGRLPSETLAREGRWTVFRRDVLPIGAGVLLSALYFRIDLFMVAAWAGTESAGLYNAVFRLVEALRLFPAAVLAVELPRLCRAENTKLLARVSLTVTGVAVAAVVVLTPAASWGIPLLYGGAFMAAVPAFRILLWSFPLMSLNYALTHQLIGWDGQKSYAAVCGLALAANVAMNAWAIPTFGIVGAAWSTFWTEAGLTAGCTVALWSMARRSALETASVTAVV